MASRHPYDKTIKIGDYIYAYRKGVHRVIDITSRHGMTPLFTYEKVLTHNWQPTTRKEVHNCDASWCRKITRQSISMEIEDLVRQYKEAAELLFGL